MTLTIPEDLVERLGATNLPRQALEALAVEAFRAGRLTPPDLCRLLGLGTSVELDAFLRAHGIEASRAATKPEDGRERPDTAEALFARFRAFRVGKRLSGLDPVALIREGRR
ncbi:MAG: UPF0175 family protein [Acetobacteraceae bacterium]|nr:UPF0175 family protein [Acetobacteraceae bacterium]